MKKLILIPCLIIFLASCISYAQIKQPQNNITNKGYWNASISAGPMFFKDGFDSEHKYSPGYNAGFEIFYMLKNHNTAIVFGLNFSKAEAHDYENQYFKQSGLSEKREFTFGPRFYPGKGYFVEAAVGDVLSSYNFKAVNEPNYLSGIGTYEMHPAGASIMLGAGKSFSLTENTDLLIKARFSCAFISGKTILNSSLNGGIVFNNKKTDREAQKNARNSNWSITATGGIVNPEVFHVNDYSISGNFGLEGALNNNSKSELFLNMNYNKVSAKGNLLGTRNIIDITFGPRFFFGNSRYSVFAEAGAGIYFINYIKDDNINPHVNTLGGKIGPGILIGVSRHLAFIAKSNLHLIFYGHTHPGGFLTASGGLRYML